jgi:type VI secretion system protein
MAELAIRPGRSSGRGLSLAERLRADDLQIDQTGEDFVAARVASIRTNLVTLLNARRGLSDSAPSYGLAEFNGVMTGSLDLMRTIARDIQLTISKFEPRVANVVVGFDRGRGGDSDLFFQVSVQTTVKDKADQLKIDLVLRKGQRFELQ